MTHDNVTDILERLRAWEPFVSDGYQVPAAGQVMHEAAALIEAQQADLATLRKQLENARSEMERRDKNETRNCLNWGPCSRHDEPMSDAIQNLSAYGAISRIASIKADDGDDFSDYDDSTIIRCEITVGDLKAIRELEKQSHDPR